MAESKECLWVVSLKGTPMWVFRSRASARAYRDGKLRPQDYSVGQVKWGPERQKG